MIILKNFFLLWTVHRLLNIKIKDQNRDWGYRKNSYVIHEAEQSHIADHEDMLNSQDVHKQ